MTIYLIAMAPLAVGGRRVPDVGLLILAGAGLAIGIGVYLGWRYEKKRTERFEAMARTLGLAFIPRDDGSLLDRLRPFHLFSQGRSQAIRNLLRGDKNDVEMAVLDYQYTTGSGKHSHTHRLSVLRFRSPTLNLPRFTLRPEGIFHKIGSALGYQDVDFEFHPEFSSSYLLRGEDESQIRKLFNETRLRFFEDKAADKICVEAAGDQLIYYRQNRRVDPDDVHDFIERGLRVLKVFQGRVDA